MNHDESKQFDYSFVRRTIEGFKLKAE